MKATIQIFTDNNEYRYTTLKVVTAGSLTYNFTQQTRNLIVDWYELMKDYLGLIVQENDYSPVSVEISNEDYAFLTQSCDVVFLKIENDDLEHCLDINNKPCLTYTKELENNLPLLLKKDVKWTFDELKNYIIKSKLSFAKQVRPFFD